MSQVGCLVQLEYRGTVVGDVQEAKAASVRVSVSGEHPQPARFPWPTSQFPPLPAVNVMTY